MTSSSKLAFQHIYSMCYRIKIAHEKHRPTSGNNSLFLVWTTPCTNPLLNQFH